MIIRQEIQGSCLKMMHFLFIAQSNRQLSHNCVNRREFFRFHHQLAKPLKIRNCLEIDFKVKSNVSGTVLWNDKRM